MLLFLIGLLTILLISNNFNAHAASSQALNIQISPLPIQLTAKPGSTVSNELRVRNSGTTDETLKLTVVKISTEGAIGFPAYTYILDANGQTVDNEPGQSDIPVTANVSFWGVPWRLIFFSIFIVTFVLIGLLATGKKILRITVKYKQQRLHK